MEKKETKEIAKKVLGVLAAGAFLTLAAAAPGSVIVAKPVVDWLRRCDQRRLRAELKRMEAQKVIEFKETKDGETIIRITKNGREKILRYKFQDLQIPKPKKWDKIWRIVIFDIPRQKNKARDALRAKLNQLGFYRLQNSVFIYPYECDNEIEFIKAFFSVQGYVSIIRAKEVDNEDLLKRHFRLASTYLH